MNNRAYALVTGLFVLVMVAAIVVAAVFLGGSHQQTKPYIVVTTGNVYGLAPRSTVYFRGIAAGQVDSIGFDPADPRRILIHIEVNTDIPVTRDTYAVSKLQGVTGLSQLGLQTSGRSSEPLATSAQAPARIPLRPSLLDQLSDTGTKVVAQLDTLTISLNQLLNADNREHIRRLLAQADVASANLVKLETDLDAGARRMPALAGQMQTTLSRVDDLTKSLNQLTQQAETLVVSGQVAGQKINSETLPRLNAALAQITAASAQIRRLAGSLQKNPQQLLLGPQRTAPGPGEPGYKGPSP
ncbi:MAG: MlaD family protein [Gammaproteobacteria bacterium]